MWRNGGGGAHYTIHNPIPFHTKIIYKMEGLEIEGPREEQKSTVV